MNISSINHTSYSAYVKASVVTTDGENVSEETLEIGASYSETNVEAVAGESSADGDTYVPSSGSSDQSGEVSAYSPPKKLTNEQIQQIQLQAQERLQSFVQQVLSQQANIGSGKYNFGNFTFDAASLTMSHLGIEIAIPTTQAEAEAAIAEDGQWGVNAVATRLMDFAMALSNGDSAHAEELRAAVQKGFEKVGALDDLPQVCQDTYEETMNRFDYWVENGSLEGYGETEETANGTDVPENPTTEVE